jgi:Ulp1 family protease
VVATLRDYLRIEYRVKEGKDREFNKDTIKGSTPKVPQQTNFTDCGLYVLQYVENFFQVMLSEFSACYQTSWRMYECSFHVTYSRPNREWREI